MFYLNPDAPSHPGGPDPNFNGWVYLAYDYRHLDHTKIGITTRPLFKRIRESTTNPWYALFCGFHLPADHTQLKRVESYLGWKLHVTFVDHLSGAESEWCKSSPSDVLSILVEIIPNVVHIDPDEGDYDFTKTIYLPAVNPYDAMLADEQLDEYIRFAAPEMYLDELRNGYRNWDARPNLVAEVAGMGPRTPLTISGPQLLMDRINYDIARRQPA
ncbi:MULTISPECIES: hypothetical protein [Paraburkholderia]|uniref:Uncharacterized protein n=1 Tax=Paraburkholderia madseniana TaxID=2599607 RepID=A0AAP5BQB7_9BURK|nr:MULTISPECIES: hypothetical protein [Paraburkholderia]MCX4152252.1 hypothetical protein [Paraburkholderia madseniana]MDN7155181.1 hypothetical protein [Paraburkholderia sp. WS6]MDQ6414064.1 hypothetical protein [Paraburkholderia madseniana]